MPSPLWALPGFWSTRFGLLIKRSSVPNLETLHTLHPEPVQPEQLQSRALWQAPLLGLLNHYEVEGRTPKPCFSGSLGRCAPTFSTSCPGCHRVRLRCGQARLYTDIHTYLPTYMYTYMYKPKPLNPSILHHQAQIQDFRDLLRSRPS